MSKTRSNRKPSQLEKVTVVVKKEVDADINEELDPDFDISDSEVKHEVSTSESESEENGGDEAETWRLEKPQGKKKKDVDQARSRREKQRDYDRNRKRDLRKLQVHRERENKWKIEKRKKMREENPEQYEVYKRKHREAKNRMREKMKKEHPEKWEALKERNRERRKNAREALKRKLEILQAEDPGNFKECEIKEAEAKRMRLTIINEARNMRRRARAAELKKQNRPKRIPEERKEEVRKNRKKQSELPVEKQEEVREKKRFYNLMRSVKMTEEEKEAAREKQRNYLKSLTGEKLERYKQSLAKAARKQQEKLKNDPSMKRNQISEKQRERLINYQRKKVANETPEERQKRLRKYKINAARRKLRKELEEIGVPPWEIERRSKLMKEEMEKEPLPPLKSEYRPRLQGRKPHRVSSQKSTTRSSTRSSSNVTPGESSIQEGDPHFDDHMFDNDNSSLPSPSPCNMSACEGEDTSQSSVAVRNEDDMEQSFEAIRPEPTPVPVNHVCEECNGSFISEDDVRTHFKLVHVQKCWKCPKCSKLCISPADFAEHYKSHNGSNQKLVKQRESENQKTTSTNDNAEAKSPRSRSSNAKLSFSCLKCQEKCKNLNSLSEHVSKFHPESFWQCPTCKLLKYHESSLLNHQKFCNNKAY